MEDRVTERQFSKRSTIASWSWLCPMGTLFVFVQLALPALAQTANSVAHPLDRTGIVGDAIDTLARDLTEAGDGAIDLLPVLVPADDARQSVQLVYDGGSTLRSCRSERRSSSARHSPSSKYPFCSTTSTPSVDSSAAREVKPSWAAFESMG